MNAPESAPSAPNPSLFNRIARLPLGAILVLAANLFPLAGVYFWGWDSFIILCLYWAETAIMGIFMILELVLVALFDRNNAIIARLFAAAFMGLFFSIHGLFLWQVFSGPWFAKLQSVQDVIDKLLIGEGLWLPVAIMVLGRGYGFITSVTRQIATPRDPSTPLIATKVDFSKKDAQNTVLSRFYGRVVLLHVAIILGAFIVMKLGSVAPLIVLIILKTALDLRTALKDAKPEAVTLSSVAQQNISASAGSIKGAPKWGLPNRSRNRQ